MRYAILFLLLPAIALAGDPKNSPSKVSDGVLESALPTLKITEQAEKRLGIELTAITSKSVAETRLYAGEIMLSLAPSGAELAPLPPGTTEELRLLAAQQNNANGAVTNAQVQLDAAAAIRQRAELAPRNIWSLHNAFTEVLKGNLPMLPGRTERLHLLLDDHVGLAS